MDTTDASPLHQSAPLGSTIRSSLRVGLVLILALASLIPLLIVDGIADERQRYFNQAQNEVANSWGRPQHFTGPVLIVPIDYVQIVPEQGWRPEKTPLDPSREHIILLPDVLTVNASIDHEMRKRSIYEVALFSADVAVNGVFESPRERIEAHLSSLPGREGVVDWEGARLVMGVTDPRAIRLPTKTASDTHNVTDLPMTWNETALELEPGQFENIIGNGVQSKVTVPPSEQDASFALNLGLGTTEHFVVNALGGTTTYSVESSWPHPSFSGNHSPIRRTISASGFSADWEVHGLARSLPDTWVHEHQQRSLMHQQMSVAFYNPITPYTSIDRGIKYGLLFIALTFLTFFCVELIVGVRFHVVQYAVVSLGLIMFYMTLLAASEHLAFSLSYVLATLLIAGLLGAYTWAMTRAVRITGLIIVVLLGLYGTLYVLLQLEDFALLVGTALLLVGLGALMFATRNLHLIGYQGADEIQATLDPTENPVEESGASA